MNTFTTADNRFLKSIRIAPTEVSEGPAVEKQKRTPYEWVHILRCRLHEAETVNEALLETMEEMKVYHEQDLVLLTKAISANARNHRRFLAALSVCMFLAAGIVGYGIWRLSF